MNSDNIEDIRLNAYRSVDAARKFAKENNVFTVISSGIPEETFMILPNGETIGLVEELSFSSKEKTAKLVVYNGKGIANEIIANIQKFLPLVDLKVKETP